MGYMSDPMTDATDPTDVTAAADRFVSETRAAYERVARVALALGYTDLRLDMVEGYPMGTPAHPTSLSGVRSGQRYELARGWIDTDAAMVSMFRMRLRPELHAAMGRPDMVIDVVRPSTPMTAATGRVGPQHVDLGAHVYVTDGAREARDEAYLHACLDRHRAGNYGVVDGDDQHVNDRSAATGGRVLSAYPLDPAKPCRGWGDNTIWIITEGVGDARHTTILLPDEY